MREIKPFTSEYDGYRKDESRSTGYAESISFPETEEEIREILRTLYAEKIPVTVQGGRTGVAGGAVPYGGHILNLSRMNHFLGMMYHDGRYTLRLQPGVVLSELRKALENRQMNTVNWSKEEAEVWEMFTRDREYFFPTDPTETSACLGGIAACNASGARSYRYGAARNYIRALRVALCDGSMLSLRRGECLAKGRCLTLRTEEGREMVVDLPTYSMPQAKNASGYYIEDDMDAVDLFVGSDGTLGVITELELELIPLPPVIWGVSCFLREEAQALELTIRVRDQIPQAAAIEYFDGGAIEILRRQKAKSSAFAALPEVEPWADCCVYVELQCETEAEALEALYHLGDCLVEAGGREEDTWVARTPMDKEKQQFFRHAVPESTNMLIDERKRVDPIITKLAADMSVPDQHLTAVMKLYREGLNAYGLETAIWGHIGDNHLHVNILPRDGEDYRKGKLLYAKWAEDITRMGGAVSAEHGVGKLKRDFLTVMYGQEQIQAMARMKQTLDPDWIFGRGNLFAPDVLQERVTSEDKEGKA